LNLYLHGHSYKYAVEQVLLTLFPTQRPEYPDKREDGDSIDISLNKTENTLTAYCTLKLGDNSYKGRASEKLADICGEIETDRACQKIIKTAIYRAALRSGLKKPAWGALTGVRPGKILHSIISGGASADEALKRFIEQYDVSQKRAQLCMDTTLYTIDAERSLGEKDICLYVGIPFCPTRCAYCSFVSQSVEKSMKLIDPFMEALEKEISATGKAVKALELNVVAIYMGGGTPTTLSAPQLDTLCTWVENAFDLSNNREYTVEAGRPDTITEEKLIVLRNHGVDRISVNPQTMSDRVLDIIGRRHTSHDILSALETARKVGGFAINMDLIAGLPADTVEGFEDTLNKVIALEPENITVHTLSLKKGSRITLNEEPIPSAEDVSDMLDIAAEKLSRGNYIPYYLYRQKFMSGGFENVGWTKKDRENLYNICIMEELCSIIAMGGGGSTKLVAPGTAKNIRLMAPKYPLEYINAMDKTCEDKQKIIEFFSRRNDHGIRSERIKL